jgi:hypothetical protein
MVDASNIVDGIQSMSDLVVLDMIAAGKEVRLRNLYQRVTALSLYKSGAICLGLSRDVCRKLLQSVVGADGQQPPMWTRQPWPRQWCGMPTQ